MIAVASPQNETGALRAVHSVEACTAVVHIGVPHVAFNGCNDQPRKSCELFEGVESFRSF
jgi:hypothetical protein